jgi:sugar-specific transcriptional regulator TrmB
MTFRCYAYPMVVHKNVEKKVVDFFGHLGFSTEESATYLYLLQRGPQTVLSLSRGLKTGRTKLYPLLDGLAERQLITAHERHYGTTYEAQKPDAIEFLVSELEQASQTLRNEWPATVNVLKQFHSISPTSSKLLEYHGADGLKQLTWNLSKAHKEFRQFELAGIDKHLGKHFISKMQQTFVERKVTGYILTNRQSFANDPDANLPGLKIRYIGPEIFNIMFESYIYNNVVTLVQNKKNDIYGIEVHNQLFTQQQRQLFDALWKQAD